MLRRDVRYQAAIVREDHVLLLKVVDLDGGAMFWVLPGGGREADETEEACVQREVREEIELAVAVVRPPSRGCGAVVWAARLARRSGSISHSIVEGIGQQIAWHRNVVICQCSSDVLHAPHRLQPGRLTVPLQHIRATGGRPQRVRALVLARGIAVL
jgi:8-oxo-dGTP pyrophosphatase MutT (NUDIX family)